ncbi:lipopolysaccharide/colanic/teichoic acid biosynthesis glycosyltransferase [Psychrobacter immobilis]|uniref:Lipopolysaccharide/colanic/teichoic acid biosynthesis glycosyltransferase n=1 Tax=Psychrobacter immobilis TaxID=498 RepID=A0A2V1ZQV3_PSYIM|nr:sugar transferase [Psychrobacter immobilis]PWK06873.1 lipopolysaccharide/colanic/teichoic acid biosynthesis glycosyltransferase [Psychrobacter immobilis]
MQQHFWQYLSVRTIVGWLIVSVVPAVLLFWGYIIADNIQLTQVHSVIASSSAVVLSIIGLERLTQFPGQKSMITVLPTLLSVGLIVGLILLIFRLPYSVYYLSTSAIIGVLFCFISQIYLRAVTQVTIAYVPIGRCQSLLDITDVRWVRLPPCFEPASHPRLPFHAVVADLADSSLTAQWEQLLAETALQGTPVYNVLQVRESLTGRLPIKHLYENNLGSLLPSQSYLLLKRLLDMLVILITAFIVIPIALLIASIIKWQNRYNRESIFFTQQRIGQGGKLFTMYKFRSMVASAEANGAQMATSDDMRVTKFGSFIRQTRLDELPQFVNVLKGDMSLIGPRPEQLDFVKRFNETIPFYRYRHIVKPGISGWAQVMQGYASDEDETKVKLEHDFFYIKNFSLTLDLLIVIKTIQTMVTGFGAR